ncbi:Xaa-Pro peptidase family protein [Sulfitobacter sp. F26204]|uniref:M24 family metallopeptidase n=1 Tax=Sulfitobacter sp. F26204 TaxID=2996014 RepID=UPI00225DD221|nr:Xaa-Pro peptidase family protein [Sulfitobacter sp. F26204]MCX7561461.1 Xaa-Pro peptidase family protein [Sulfitobacter sp. F26204]
MAKWDFTFDEFLRRRFAVQDAISAAGLDWIVLFHPVSIHWLTGWEGKSYQAFQCLLVPKDGQPMVLIMRQSEEAEAKAEAIFDELEPWGGCEPQDPLEVFARVVRRFGLDRTKVGIEVPAYYLHPHHYVKVQNILGDALAGEFTNLVPDLKLVKSDREISYIREAAKMADDAMYNFQSELAIGRTELELAGGIQHCLMRNGSGQAASTLNLVSGERTAFSHGAPTERRMMAGDFGNVEYGATYKRYTSTIGRQFSLGAPSARDAEIFAVVKAACEAAIAEMLPDTPAVRPHEKAKAIIADAGLDKYRVHTSGYGLAPGFAPSWGEPLSMFGGCTYTLQAGMVITVEPPVFIGEEKTGARIIENVLITNDGPEVLSKFPRDLIVV